MPLTRYEGPGELQFDGRTLAEAKTIRGDFNSNSTPVKTMKKGMAGRSKGAFESRIEVENAVPKGGLEQAFIEKCVEDADCRITFVFAGKRYQIEGWIDSVNLNQGTEEDAGLSFTVIGGKPLVL
jgi:hypothetical protein